MKFPLVVLNSPGFKNRLGYQSHPTVSSKTGEKQFRIHLRGGHTILTFAESEFRLATEAENEFAHNTPGATTIPTP